MVLSRRMFNWGQLPKHVPRRKPERVLSVPLFSQQPPARCHTRRPCQETVRCHNTRLLVTALSVSRAVLATPHFWKYIFCFIVTEVVRQE